MNQQKDEKTNGEQQKEVTLDELMNDFVADKDQAIRNRITRNKVFARFFCWLKIWVDKNYVDKPFSVKMDLKPHFPKYTADYLRKMCAEFDQEGGLGIIKKRLSSGNMTQWIVVKDKDGKPKFLKYMDVAISSYRHGKWNR